MINGSIVIRVVKKSLRIDGREIAHVIAALYCCRWAHSTYTLPVGHAETKHGSLPQSGAEQREEETRIPSVWRLSKESASSTEIPILPNVGRLRA
jgi:hypothetical protein